jgi:hypothetical protein
LSKTANLSDDIVGPPLVAQLAALFVK